jgi:hypothetical protein
LLETTLDAGDLLYVPPEYWHFMRSKSVSMSISRWWFDSRLAEVIYATASGFNLPRSSSTSGQDWADDLRGFGGIDALNALLQKKTGMVQFQIVMALTRHYRKEIFNVENQE